MRIALFTAILIGGALGSLTACGPAVTEQELHNKIRTYTRSAGLPDTTNYNCQSQPKEGWLYGDVFPSGGQPIPIECPVSWEFSHLNCQTRD